MLKLLQSDFYRLFRSKVFYICTLIISSLMAVSIFIMDWSSRVMGNMTTAEGLEYNLMPYNNGISYGITVFSSGEANLFMAILIAVFITAEFTHGTMKNIVSKGFKRFQIYISKVITMTAATFMMLLVMLVFGTIAATIVTGSVGTLAGVSVGEVIRMIAISLLLHTALVSVFVMVAMAVRNIGGVIAINICIILFSSMIYQLLDMLTKGKTKFAEFGLRNNILLYHNNIAPASDDIIRSIIVGVAFLAFSIFIGILAFKNTDVK